MSGTLRKLVLGDKKKGPVIRSGSIHYRIKNIQVIWNNDHHDDVGIEKIFRLFLSSSQFLFPGTYIKHFAGKMGRDVQDVSMDIYLLFKIAFPLSLSYSCWIPVNIAELLVIWMLLETLLYVPALIFASDIYSRPSSYNRSILLLFFNYLEIVFAYGFIYSCGNYLNQPFGYWYDPIYFSFVTISSIGYGDFYPVTGMGKFLVCSQTLVFLSFVILFINFYSKRVENTGYFNQDTKN